MARALCALLLVMSALPACMQAPALRVEPYGDNQILMDALLSPSEIGDDWWSVEDSEDDIKHFGGPCAEYALFTDADYLGYGAVVMVEQETGETFRELVVWVGTSLARSWMRQTQAQFTCSEWFAIGADEHMIRFNVAPLDAPKLGDEAIAYRYWTDDDT
ncbi:MAG: hypothetical protein ACRD1H_21150, partial [Vicinamibacterales bacterium]